MPGRAEGGLSGCPFCRFANSPLPQVGVRFRKLSGIDVGRTGTVVESPAPPPLCPKEFLAHMEGDPPETTMRILPREIIEPLPASEPPDWAPPISLADASELDMLIVSFCEHGNSADGWFINWEIFYRLISSVWRLRLPITGDELWRVLRAHGVSEQFEADLTGFFTKGRDLLVYTVGHRPVKKKRTSLFMWVKLGGRLMADFA